MSRDSAAMVRFLLRFARDVRGTGAERWAVTAGVVGLLCVVCTHLLDAGLRNGTVPTILVQRGPAPAAVLAGMPTPSQTSVKQSVAGVDYTATASIPSIAAGTRLDPCTGQPKP